jgi:hypothetical protein
VKANFYFGTLLICAEGTRLLENAIAFSSCVGGFVDVKFNVLREDGAGETPQALQRRGGSPNRPRKAKCLEWKSTDKFNSAKISIHFRKTLPLIKIQN